VPEPAPIKKPLWGALCPRHLPLVLCLVLTALLGTRQIAVHDLGFHLKGGQWIAEHHQVPRVDTYTYSVPGNPYVDSHWLYQLALYGLWRAGGYGALTLAHAALLVLGFLLLALRCGNPRAPAWVLPVLLVLAVFTMERRFLPRPEIVSWLFLGATFWVLESYSKRGKKTLWLLPVLQLFWANIEGLFVLGWIALGAYWLGGLIQRRKPDPALSLFGALAVAADFLNPYFARGVAYPFSFVSKMQGDIYHQTIGELKSIPDFLSRSFLSGDPKIFVYVFCLYLLAYVAVAALTFKRRKPHEILIAAVFFYLSFKAVRNIPLGVIATLPSAAAGWSDLAERLRARWPRASFMPGLKRLLPFLFALGLAAWGARVATGAYYLADLRPERIGLGLDPDMLPMEAVGYMERERLEGKILNSPNFGGWLEWGLGRPVYMDGRWEVMGEELYRRYLDTTYGKGRSFGGLSAEAARTQADIVIFGPRLEGSWADQLRQMPAWRPVYLDGCCAIYLRKGYRDEIPTLSMDGVVSALGLKAVTPEDVEKCLGGLGRSRFVYWLDGFFHTRGFPWGMYNRRLFLTGYPESGASLALDLELVRLSGGFYTPFLGWLNDDCVKLGNPNGAHRVYRRILDLNPGERLSH
jgi:hypothetical protein